MSEAAVKVGSALISSLVELMAKGIGELYGLHKQKSAATQILWDSIVRDLAKHPMLENISLESDNSRKSIADYDYYSHAMTSSWAHVWRKTSGKGDEGIKARVIMLAMSFIAHELKSPDRIASFISSILEKVNADWTAGPTPGTLLEYRAKQTVFKQMAKALRNIPPVVKREIDGYEEHKVPKWLEHTNDSEFETYVSHGEEKLPFAIRRNPTLLINGPAATPARTLRRGSDPDSNSEPLRPPVAVPAVPVIVPQNQKAALVIWRLKHAFHLGHIVSNRDDRNEKAFWNAYIPSTTESRRKEKLE